MNPPRPAGRPARSQPRRRKAHPWRERPPAAQTPGKPKDSASRQQLHESQVSQSGSPELDEQLTNRAKE